MLDVKVLAMDVVETHIMRLYCNTMLYHIYSPVATAARMV